MGAVDLICERWYLLALTALARRDRNEAAVEGFRDRLSSIETELSAAPDPFVTLAALLELGWGYRLTELGEKAGKTHKKQVDRTIDEWNTPDPKPVKPEVKPVQVAEPEKIDEPTPA